MKVLRFSLILFASLLLLCATTWSQAPTVVTSERYDEYIDSIQDHDYPYVFPIWGDKVREMGHDLPKPVGIMLGYFYQTQDLLIQNLSVGPQFADELVDISDLVTFSQVYTKNHVATFRPDFWVLPFLNVYGILNRFSAYTNVSLSEPLTLTVPEINNNGIGGGFGTTLAYGWGPIWASGNLNFAWSKTPVLITPTQSLTSSIRVGTHLWNRKRTQHISVWVGANYQDYLGDNGGTYDMNNLFPGESPLLEELLEQVQDLLDGLNERYEDFCASPGNRGKCAVLDPILEQFKDNIEDKISGVEPPPLIIAYGFNSSPAKNWNMVTGAQYTLHKRWDFRTEFGFIGRRSFMFNVNYRFGFKRKIS